MWEDPRSDLDNHVKVSSTLQIESLVIAEWNMNDFVSLYDYGSYKFRPSASASQYFRVPMSYDNLDAGSFYRNSEKSFFTFSDFVDDADEPVLFESQDVNRSLYFKLEDCFKPFRPRSGINKALYFEGKYIDNVKTARRPRYYMASKYDNFKYWNSYRTQVENNEKIEVGVSQITNPTGFTNDIGYLIDDTAPFVVYKDAVPANRIVVKMQTNLADSTSTFNIRNTSDEIIVDPFQDRTLSSIPKRWKIEYLDESGNWNTAANFNENSLRRDDTDIVKWDGHVELYYGIKIPDEYKEGFNLIDYLDLPGQLPGSDNLHGESYVIGSSTSNAGTIYTWNSEDSDWVENPVEYGFSLYEEDNDVTTIGTIKGLTDPKYYRASDNQIVYRDIAMIKGLRIVIETMIAPDTTFDLIELSARIKADVSDQVMSYNFSKSIANDQNGIPVGGLLATNGTVSLLNFDGAFTENNIFSASAAELAPRTGSIVAKYLKPNIKFTFYEAILNVNGYNKYVPMKTLYSEEFPPGSGGDSVISIPVRDLFFRLESMRATPVFLTDVTLTSAVGILLDSIGFSNYIFKGFDEVIKSNGKTIYPGYYPPWPPDMAFAAAIGYGPYDDRETGKKVPVEQAWDIYWNRFGGKEGLQEYFSSIKDTVIPFFFVSPDYSVSQVLIDLATSCQAAMYFDEYNNLVVMPKEYILPDNNKRTTSMTLYGQVENDSDGNVIALPNIIALSNSQTRILNDGAIQYNIRYIQKEASSLQEQSYLNVDRSYVYKPVLLWEVGNNKQLRTTNESQKESSGYALGAVPLNTSLSSAVPYVENNIIKNNTIDIGENAYWLPRFQGYLFANGEIIRYDAVEYSVSGTGNVWISNNQDYQKYFSSIPFNGKIFPTGNIRIFVEPYYIEYENAPQTESLQSNVTYKNGSVKRHGRGQFGTEIVEHSAGLSEYWQNDDNIRGCEMDSQYIFSTTPTENLTYPTYTTGTTAIGSNNDLAKKSTRNGIIRNWLAQTYPSDDELKTLKTTETGTVQSSGLVFSGPLDFTSPSEVVSALPFPNPSNPSNANTNSNLKKRDFISYIYKSLESPYKHVGTRLRIIGKLETTDKIQAPLNSTNYFNVQPSNTSENVNIDGGSAGIAIGINPETNHGYFFEICSLTADNLEDYQVINKDTKITEKVLHNIIFYKTVNVGGKAVAVKLWGGLAKIIVDEGLFVGMNRIGAEENPTVYDLSVEYLNVGNSRKFYLYINGNQVGVVEDASPMPEYSNLALFVRGSTEAIFENVYALQNLMSKNNSENIFDTIPTSFGTSSINASESLRKYAVSGFVKASYLTGVSSGSSPQYKMYFEEFGTIMRECAYFNVRYDQAYPALISKIAPTFNQEPGYSISGFYGGSYGAEFLIFNNTDRTLLLDETTGHYLRILGVAFTQDVSEELTVDDFFRERSSLSDPLIVDSDIKSPIVADKIYDTIKSSRQKYGQRQFTLNPMYIQSVDDANDLMEWMINKTVRERQAVDAQVFGTPQLQLGDLVTIDYDMPEGNSFVDTTKQFVVYGIDFSRSLGEKSTFLRLVEV